MVMMAIVKYYNAVHFYRAIQHWIHSLPIYNELLTPVYIEMYPKKVVAVQKAKPLSSKQRLL